MTVALSSLRVAADIDSSAYVRGMQAKVAADREGAASSRAVGAALAQTDAQMEQSGGAAGRLSRSLIDGYGSGSRFEQVVRSIGRAVDQGMGLDRAAILLDAAYRKFGLTADAASLTRQGFVQLAPVVDSLNNRLSVQAEVADRAAAAAARLTEAQRAQATINARLGVRDEFGGEDRAADVAAYGAELDRLQAKYDPLFAAEQRYRIELEEISTAHRVGAIDATRMAAAQQQAQQRFTAASGALGGVAQGTKLTAFEVQNLGYQFGDLGVQLASGASPFMAILQQGAQITGVLGQRGVGGAVAALKEGFLGMLTPVNLWLIGIAAAAGAVSLLWNAFSSAGDAEAMLERHREIVEEITRAYRDAEKGAEDWGEKLRGVSMLQAQENLRKQREILENEIAELRSVLDDRGFMARARLFESPFVEDFERLNQLAEAARTGRITISQYIQELDRLGQTSAAAAVRDLALHMQEEAENAGEAERRTLEAEAAIRLLSGTATDADRAVLGLAGATRELAAGLSGLRAAVPALAEAMRAQQGLGEASRNYQQAQADIEDLYRRGEIGSGDYRAEMENLNRTYKAAVDEITGLAGVQRTANEELNDFVDAGRLAGMDSHGQAVARLTRQYEDLTTRMREGQLSPEAFDAAKRALDQQIAALNAQNAETAAGAGSGGGSALSRESEYQRAIASIREQTAALRDEAKVFDLSTFAAERYRTEQELLAAAQAEGIPISEALRQEIAQAATDYARGASEMERLRERQQQINESWDFFGRGFLDIASAARDGLDGMSDAALRFADALYQAALQAFILGQGPLAGLFGISGGGLFGAIRGMFGGGLSSGAADLTGAGLFHAGTSSVGASDNVRYDHAAAWASAPRFHMGLAPDERRGIFQTGERIFSRSDNRSLVAAIDRVSARTAQPQRADRQRPVVVQMTVNAMDAGSFRRPQAQAQIASDLARAVARGQRNL